MTAVAERVNGAVAHGQPMSAELMERVLIGGDLSRLSDTQRMSYYKAVCDSVGLNPLTKPFAYISLNGKLQLYALKDCTEQLRKIHGVSIERIERQVIEGCYVVTAYAKDKTGRTDGSTGAVSLGALKGEALANAYMKAETKAKRRVTLSICGLGMLDETEAASIPGAQVISAEIQPMPVAEASVDPDADFTHEQRLEAVQKHALTIQTIKDALADMELKTASGLWYSLPEREQRMLWFAPTKGGPFTTDERKLIKTPEFRMAYHTGAEA